MDYQTLKVERRDRGVVLWTIDNPPANAITDVLLEDLDHAAEAFGADKETRVIVVTSAHPKTFLAGADLKMMIQSGGNRRRQAGRRRRREAGGCRRRSTD